MRKSLKTELHRQLEESYLNQYADSDDDASEVDDLEETLDECNLSEEEVFDDELYCVACNKFFNSDSAKLNHEASKKHKQNIELLKSQMNAEEEIYQQTNSPEVDAAEDHQSDHSDVAEEKEPELEPAKKSKGKKSKKKNKKVINFDDSDAEPEEIVQEVVENLVVEPEPVQSDDANDWSSSKKSKKTKSKGKSKNEKVKPAEPEEAPIETVKSSESVPPEAPEEPENDSSEHRCATCRDIFPSKNKLFAHLKKTNHSIYLGEVKAKVAEKTTSRKKK